MTVFEAIPEKITARTKVEYRRDFPSYPADDAWAAKLYLRGPSIPAAVDGVPDGASFVFTLSTAFTAPLLPGVYTWEERAIKAGEEYVAGNGRVEVLIDLTTATADTAQSFEQILLANVEAAIRGEFSANGRPAESYSIAGRSIVKMSMRELLDLRAMLRRTVRQQANPGTFGPQVQVRFPGLNFEAEAPWLGGTQ